MKWRSSQLEQNTYSKVGKISIQTDQRRPSLTSNPFRVLNQWSTSRFQGTAKIGRGPTPPAPPWNVEGVIPLLFSFLSSSARPRRPLNSRRPGGRKIFTPCLSLSDVSLTGWASPGPVVKHLIISVYDYILVFSFLSPLELTTLASSSWRGGLLVVVRREKLNQGKPGSASSLSLLPQKRSWIRTRSRMCSTQSWYHRSTTSAGGSLLLPRNR